MARNNSNDGMGIVHTATRVLQVLTLIPAWALLAAVIAHYDRNDALTPGSIHFLFIVTLLASVWSFCILITYLRAKNTALWMTFFDVVAMTLLIAAVVVLGDIANIQCIVNQVITPTPDTVNSYTQNYIPDDKWWNTRLARFIKRQIIQDSDQYTYRQHCGEIKAAWGLAIANIFLFFISAILTVVIYGQNQQPFVRKKIIIEPPLVHPAPSVAAPPPVFQNPYYGPPRRHSRDHSHHSHRSYRNRSHGGSYYKGSRRGSDYYV